MYLIDSYAWVEYFIGSTKGEVLQKLLQEERNSFLTVECCLAEIRGWALRNKKEFDTIFKLIRANSTIITITEQDWIAAAVVWFELRKKRKHFGLVDAVILVKQSEHRCKVISGDPHFKDLKDVVFLR
ncbi:TPA: PIN domain-containing protein [Candidatus Woesearchaeota archaeon]|nr:PIN domain-containing protein [Candidatus Woesearchaeota archaeon]